MQNKAGFCEEHQKGVYKNDKCDLYKRRPQKEKKRRLNISTLPLKIWKIFYKYSITVITENGIYTFKGVCTGGQKQVVLVQTEKYPAKTLCSSQKSSTGYNVVGDGNNLPKPLKGTPRQGFGRCPRANDAR